MKIDVNPFSKAQLRPLPPKKQQQQQLKFLTGFLLLQTAKLLRKAFLPNTIFENVSGIVDLILYSSEERFRIDASLKQTRTSSIASLISRNY